MKRHKAQLETQGAGMAVHVFPVGKIDATLDGTLDAADREKKCREFTGSKNVCFDTDSAISKLTAALSIDHYLRHRSLHLMQ